MPHVRLCCCLNFGARPPQVSTLSKGPVAPSDKINASNPELILKSCKADGQLLQGDKPAMVLDSQHAARAFSGGRSGSEIWATQTVLDGHTFAVVLGATVSADTTIAITTDLKLPKDVKHVAYEANATGVVRGCLAQFLSPRLPVSPSPRLPVSSSWHVAFWRGFHNLGTSERRPRAHVRNERVFESPSERA